MSPAPSPASTGPSTCVLPVDLDEGDAGLDQARDQNSTDQSGWPRPGHGSGRARDRRRARPGSRAGEQGVGQVADQRPAVELYSAGGDGLDPAGRRSGGVQPSLPNAGAALSDLLGGLATSGSWAGSRLMRRGGTGRRCCRAIRPPRRRPASAPSGRIAKGDVQGQIAGASPMQPADNRAGARTQCSMNLGAARPTALARCCAVGAIVPATPVVRLVVQGPR